MIVYFMNSDNFTFLVGDTNQNCLDIQRLKQILFTISNLVIIKTEFLQFLENIKIQLKISNIYLKYIYSSILRDHFELYKYKTSKMNMNNLSSNF